MKASDERPAVHERFGNISWLVAGGLAHIALGVLALLLAVIATFASVIAFGAILAGGGFLQLAQAVQARAWRGLSFYLLTGIVTIFAGISLIMRPAAGALALTLLLAGFFMAQGAFRVVVATMADHLPGRALQVLNGVVTFALGLIIGLQWPEGSLWVIGVVVGIDLISTGASQVAGASLVRRREALGHDAHPSPGVA